MKAIKIKDLKRQKEFYFVLRPYDEKYDTGEDMPSSNVWCIDGYCREERKYDAYKFDDCNHYNQFKGDRIVYVGFSF